MKTYLIVWIINLTIPTFYHMAVVDNSGKIEIWGCIPNSLIGCMQSKEYRERYFQERHFEIVLSSNVPIPDSSGIPGIINQVEIYDFTESTMPIKVWKP